MRVGFIGLGSQGAGMARMIAEAGMDLSVWARRKASLDALEGAAAKLAPTPDALAASVDVLCLCVRDDDDVRDVTEGAGTLAALASGSVLVIHSTVHPDTCRRVAELGAPRGVGVLDAPVSGGGSAALAKTLAVMVGGSAEDFERCRPVFECYASLVRHLGPLGSGQVCKLVNNGLFASGLKLACDALGLAQELGLHPDAFVDVVQAGSGSSFALSTARRVSDAGAMPAQNRRAMENLVKDARILESLAGELADSDLRRAMRASAAWIGGEG